MNERDLIIKTGEQPVASFSDRELTFLINRDFPDQTDLVKTKLNKINSDTRQEKNRISASVLKLADKDLTKIDFLVKRANEDFRDIVSEAEYPRAHEKGFELFDEEEKVIREVLLADWKNSRLGRIKNKKERPHNIGYSKCGLIA